MNRRIGILVLFVSMTVVAAASWAQTAGTVPAAPVDTSAAQKEPVPEVQLKVDTAFVYCALEMTGSYDQHAAAFEKLYEESMKQGIFGGMPFDIYWNNPENTPVEKLKWELGFVMPAGKIPQEPLKLKKWEFTTMATLRYTGNFDEEMGKAFGRLYQWIEDRGYQPAGPMMEMFLNAPSADERGVYFGTVDIIVPIQKAPAEKDKSAK